MSDSTFALFLGFSGIWIVMGVVAIAWVMRIEGLRFQPSKEVLIVALSVLLPFILALWIGYSSG